MRWREAMATAALCALPALATAQVTMARARYADVNGSREYAVYRPSSLPAQNRALVVMLHGCTQGADDFARGTRMNDAADRAGFIVLYPEQDAASHPQKCWNWYTRGQVMRDAGEVAMLAGLIDSVTRAEGIAANRVAVVGMSAGGAMAANLAAEYPERVAALAIHSGIPALSALDLASALKAMREGATPEGLTASVLGAMGPRKHPMPVIALHGADDKVVSPLNLDAIVEQWSSANAQIAPQGAQLVVRHLIPGVGHAWSGGSSTGSYTAPTGPDATELVVDFLLRHGIIGR